MADVLLSLIMPDDVAQHVEDLLLSRPDLVPGFTVSTAEGHGSVIPLVEDAELVAGHAPRTVIRTVGPEADKREVLALIKQKLPNANVFFWLVPVIDKGRL
ncbi:hypothetical protein AT959_07995 [Dechloromonas denitrificans]|uniref:DUF3240 domain-containing protein n=1 Tax=Dechloromonas denitrificans TaxID=281362 RepID=A0A133XIB1_9RHOO|nr:DUF3240 family protein [Dechloromonas denitrificans]KXB30671.1 hypothetical protein AT959_07995 [Dechloromonas denitrificans]